VHGHVIVMESKEYSYKIWPTSIPRMPVKELSYEVTFRAKPLAAEPYFFQQAELTTNDPLHKMLKSKHKAFPLTVPAGQTALIEVRYEQSTLNPIIVLFEAESNSSSRHRGRGPDGARYFIIYTNSSKKAQDMQLVVASRDDENLGKFTVTARTAR